MVVISCVVLAGYILGRIFFSYNITPEFASRTIADVADTTGPLGQFSIEFDSMGISLLSSRVRALEFMGAKNSAQLIADVQNMKKISVFE